MDSRRWLVGLGGVVAVLAALLVVDLVGEEGSGSGEGSRVVPEWDVRGVKEVRIERVREEVIVERGVG